MTSRIAKPLWALLVQSLSKQKRRVAVIAMALMLLSLSQGGMLFLIGPFLKTMFGGQWLGESINAGKLFGESVIKIFPQLSNLQFSRSSVIQVVPVVLVCLGFLRSVANYLYNFNQQAVSLVIATDLRARLFSAILAMPYLPIKKRSPGSWMSVIMNDVVYIQNRLSEIAAAVIKDTIVLISSLVAMSLIHLPTAIALLVISPVMALAMGRVGRRIANFSSAWQKEMANLNAVFLSIRQRFPFIRAQRGEPNEMKHFAGANEKYYQNVRRSILIRGAFAPGLETLGFMIFAGIIALIGSGNWGPGFSAVVMLQFFAALGLILRPLRNFGEQFSRLGEILGSLREAGSILESAGGCLPTSWPEKEPVSRITAVTIRSIKVGYDHGITFGASNLHLKSGEAIAVVGPSGSGKSTLLMTIAGLLRPIAWDSNSEWQALSGQSVLVSQYPFLFDDTLKANLVYGSDLPSASFEQKVQEALMTVNMADEVAALPEGINTHFRSLSSNLSGGQVQRLAVARALIRDRQFLLLDEATSALDASAERDLLLRLISYCRSSQRVVVAVTHRLRWLDQFDQIWFIENGRVVGCGSHAELMTMKRYEQFCYA